MRAGQPGRMDESGSYPTSPGTHVVGPWVIDTKNLYRDLRTGTQYIGNWASKDRSSSEGCYYFRVLKLGLGLGFRVLGFYV